VEAMDHCDMLGQQWRKRLTPEQQLWVREQRWCVTPPAAQAVFCTGGWWTIRSAVLAQYDWPTRDLRHKGGDMMLGELCRQQGLRVGKYDRGVRINADAEGRHSKAARRGLSADNGPERDLGAGYIAGDGVSRAHHDFAVVREFFGVR